MRILFTAHPYVSHYFQMVGLAWAFRAQGHEVRIATQPGLIPFVTASGMIGVPVGGDYDVVANSYGMMQKNSTMARKAGVGAGGTLSPEERRHISAARMVPFIESAQDIASDLVAFARWWRPDVVIADPAVYAAPLAAEAVGALLLRHLWGLDETWRGAMPGNGVSDDDDPRAQWPAELVDLYRQYGVKPRPLMAARTLDICPASLQFPGVPERIPVRYTPYNGPGEVPGWLAIPPARRRICVTWGMSTTTMTGPNGFMVPQVLDGLAGLDAEIVVTLSSSDRALLREVPSNVRLTAELPLNLLLPTCSAIIHQGGGGTMLTAAALGVPQVIVANLPYQTAHARRLAAVTAAVWLDWLEADHETISAATATALTDDLRTGAHRLRQEMEDQPSPAQTVKTIEELI